MIWLKENMMNIIVIMLVGSLVLLCIRSLAKQRRSGRPACSCGKSCAGCAIGCLHSQRVQ